MLNQCTFLGRLTHKPELRKVGDGKSIVSFTLAVLRDLPNQSGEWITDFIDFVAWNKLAEKICNKYETGDLLTVSGRLQNRSNFDKDGNESIVAEIHVRECHRVYIKTTSSLPDFALIDRDDSNLPFTNISER